MKNFFAKLALGVSVTLGILMVLLFAIFKISADIETNSATIFRLGQDLNSRSSILSEVTRLKNIASEVLPLSEKLKKALPTEDELISFSDGIKLSAQHYELGYGFKFGQTAGVSSGLRSIRFDMNLQGSRENILKLLDDVEANGRFINVSNIDIAQQGDKYTATLSGLIYYRG